MYGSSLFMKKHVLHASAPPSHVGSACLVSNRLGSTVGRWRALHRGGGGVRLRTFPVPGERGRGRVFALALLFVFFLNMLYGPITSAVNVRVNVRTALVVSTWWARSSTLEGR